jgi:hypothetical protein
MDIGVLAQLPQGPGLGDPQLLVGPLLALAQPVPVARDAQDHSQVTAARSRWSWVEEAVRRPGGLWVCGVMAGW